MPTYAVIFTSTLRLDAHGYEAASQRMLKKVASMPGYLGADSARSPDGQGITVSYWSSLEAIRAWGSEEEHRQIQEKGKKSWYSEWKLRIAEVKEERSSANLSG